MFRDIIDEEYFQKYSERLQFMNKARINQWGSTKNPYQPEPDTWWDEMVNRMYDNIPALRSMIKK